jgi:hypothetical protein
MSDQCFADLAARLPRHARLVASLRDAVLTDERWRWFAVSCSLGAGRGDELSDIDCAIGFAESLGFDEVEVLGDELVVSIGDVADMLINVAEGWQPDTRRFGVEYVDGLQLDLVLMPARRISGLRDGELAIVDKDGVFAVGATSSLYGPPGERLVREWALMAWWWVSDVAKYLTRRSMFEASERIALVRYYALRLFAAASHVPYPVYGLASLLDYEPFELPDGLADTYPVPDNDVSAAAAASAVAALLADCSRRANTALGYDLSTPWEAAARQRLGAAMR